jgi:hypothetical protein
MYFRMPGQPGRSYSCDECVYVGPKYRVRKHILDRHIDLSEIPYLCLFCGARFDSKSRASHHLPEHGENFRDTFKGTYEDRKQFPMTALSEEEAQQRQAELETSREDKLARLLSPSLPRPDTPCKKRKTEPELELEINPIADDSFTSSDASIAE